MPTPIRTIEPRHLALRCVACGLSLRSECDDDACPRCGTDFEARPPRSYAEMEGLTDARERPVIMRRPVWQERRLVERWLAVAFAGALLVIFALAIIVGAGRP